MADENAPFEQIKAPQNHNQGPAQYSGGEHDTWTEAVGKINRMFGKLFGSTSSADAEFDASDSDKRFAALEQRVAALEARSSDSDEVPSFMQSDDFRRGAGGATGHIPRSDYTDETERADSDEVAASQANPDPLLTAPRARTEQGRADVSVKHPGTTTGGLKANDQNLGERYIASGATGSVQAEATFGTAGAIIPLADSNAGADAPAEDSNASTNINDPSHTMSYSSADQGSLQTSSGFHGLAEAEEKIGANSGGDKQESDTMKENGEIETGKDVPFEQTAEYEPKSIVKKAGVAGQPAAPELVQEAGPDAPADHAENDIRSPANDPVKAVDNPATPPSDETLARAEKNQKNANDTKRG